jgi:hypothetical protein
VHRLKLLTRLTVQFVGIGKNLLFFFAMVSDDCFRIFFTREIPISLRPCVLFAELRARPSVDDRNQSMESERRARVGDHQ